MTSCHGSRHLRARSGWDLLPLRLEGLGGLSWGDIQPETTEAVNRGHCGKRPAILIYRPTARRRRRPSELTSAEAWKGLL